ncbi:hypothetical protein CYY_003012 [Polysphondylium violaceum]|uniref:Rab GTPase n=1 Tax=Polysphondylium violaceum TaxID=133409 RepID=A0A8J4PXA5_9MYCE|nr:hypothetical protein CYY_003012 [Polysphondylium violaceum]
MTTNTSGNQQEKARVFLKFIFLGDKRTGKSNTLIRYADNIFIDQYYTTIGIDFKVKYFEDLDPRYILCLQVWDTYSGCGTHRSIPQAYYKNASAYFVFFDITNRESFNLVKDEIANIPHANEFGQELYIIGNKIDLEGERVISREEGHQLAQDNSAQYYEISAKENINVHQTFDHIAKDLFNKKIKDMGSSPILEPPKPSCILQ